MTDNCCNPCTPTTIFLYPLNTQILQIDGLQDTTTGDYLNSATVTATLFSPLGAADPVLNDLSLSYVSDSDGSYQTTIPSEFNPPLGPGYVLQITAVESGVEAVYSIPVVVALRDTCQDV